MICFSPKTPLYLKHSICTEFSILSTSNLGMYLGSTCSWKKEKHRFNFMVEKAEKRLVEWRIQFLTKAARSMQIKSTQ